MQKWHNMKEKKIRGTLLIKISLVLILVNLSFQAQGTPLEWFGIMPQSLCSAQEQESKEVQKPSPTSEKTGSTVIIYVTSWCPACSMAIKYLKENKIPFTVKDVEKNPDHMKEMIKKMGSYRGVPVLDVKGKTSLGFHPSMVEHLKPSNP